MMQKYTLLIILLTGTNCTQLFNVVLFGGTGNLARKYLWNGFFNLFQANSNTSTRFHFYACGRTDVDKGWNILNSILEESVKCRGDDECRSKVKFKQQITYMRAKYENDYKELGDILNNEKDGVMEKRRIFYLSIPTSVYAVTASHLHKHCLPNTDSHLPWVRVVMEKPFGRDLEEAEILSKRITKYFSEEQIYRIDHYLGKSIVKQILPFRIANKHWLEKFLSHEFIDRIEIVLKETIDTKGRLCFYDETGVIRDVFQSHLTELMVLAAMDLPQNGSNQEQILRNKLHLLKRIDNDFKNKILLGQYSDYLEQTVEEGVKSEFSALVPTFAVAVAYINSPRWESIPFLLLSGKKLEQRSSYIRFIMKDNLFSLKNNFSETLSRRQIVFHIGHGDVKKPSVLVSKRFGNISWPDGLVPLTGKDFCNNSVIYGDNCENFNIARTEGDTDAYTSLINDIFIGSQKNFIPTEHMLQNWKIWNPVLELVKMETPRLYSSDSKSNLDFILRKGELRYSTESMTKEYNHTNISIDSLDFIPAILLNSSITVQDRWALCEDLAAIVSDGILTADKQDKYYHLALPGGKSPQTLLYILAQKYYTLPWHKVIVWFVDERCVRPNHKESNYNMIYSKLLKYLDIPQENILEMPVYHERRLCDPNHNRAEFYHDQIISMLAKHNKQGFDFVVLGLGTDAHVASIFPYSDLLRVGTFPRYAALTHDGSNNLSKRMTLTLSIINKAQNIAILIMGKEKHSITKELSENQYSDMQYPVTFIHPISGHMKWYIDYDAWFG